MLVAPKSNCNYSYSTQFTQLDEPGLLQCALKINTVKTGSLYPGFLNKEKEIKMIMNDMNEQTPKETTGQTIKQDDT